MLKLPRLYRFGQFASHISTGKRNHDKAQLNRTTEVSNSIVTENFENVTKKRMSEARRSIAMEVESHDLYKNVYNYCKQFGEIKNAIAYTMKDERKFVYLEYDSEDAISETMKYAGFQSNTVPWQNRFMKLRNSKLTDVNIQSVDTPLQYGLIREPAVSDILQEAETIDEQAILLYSHTCLTDISIRLKFLGALQAQDVLQYFLNDIFPNADIFPFGSSLNGYGKLGCDLDMALRFDRSDKRFDVNVDEPLQFYGKDLKIGEELRKLEGRQVKCIASIFDYILPGSSQVMSVHGARVPIVRYFDKNIYCSIDLSVNNL